jgi:hypothetical protein
VAAGALATRVQAEPSQVLVIDLGAGLGALAGAAAASPFIFKSTSPEHERIFLVSTMGATVAGGFAAWLFTRKGGNSHALQAPVLPYAGVIGTSTDATGRASPCFGIGGLGTF